MFLWRWFKKLLALIGMGTVLWWGFHFTKTNNPVKQRIEEFKQSSLWQEGVKDFKTWAGAIFKGVGTKLEEDVTLEEKKELDKILEKELGPTKKEEKKVESK